MPEQGWVGGGSLCVLGRDGGGKLVCNYSSPELGVALQPPERPCVRANVCAG